MQKPIHSINALDRLLVTTLFTTSALSKSSKNPHFLSQYYSFVQIKTFSILLNAILCVLSVFVIFGKCHMMAKGT